MLMHLSNQSRKKLFLLFALWLLVSSCASYIDEQEKLINLYKKGAYHEALEEIEESNLKESKKNRLLYLFEKGSIYRKLGDHEKSEKIFIRADQVIDELYTTSVLQTAASFVYNDSTTDYDGELFERITLHTLLAFSFLEQGKFSSARVEAKKINNRLLEFTKDLGETNNSYTKDAFALYLSGIIFEAMGEPDDALIDYKKSLSLYESPSYGSFYSGNIRPQIASALHKLSLQRGREELARSLEGRYRELSSRKPKRKMGELIVLHEAGHINLKEEKTFILPVGNQVVRFSYPVISERSAHTGKTGVTLKNGKFIRGENAAHLSSIAHQTLEEKRFRLIAKGLARVLIKSQVNRVVSENLGPLAGLLSNIVTAATETADTRSWMFLPDNFFVTRLELPVGAHSIRVSTDGTTYPPQLINIQERQPTLIKVASKKTPKPKTSEPQKAVIQ